MGNEGNEDGDDSDDEEHDVDNSVSGTTATIPPFTGSSGCVVIRNLLFTSDITEQVVKQPNLYADQYFTQ